MVAAVVIQELSEPATDIKINIKGNISTTNQLLTAACRGKKHFL
jgi:hypothetical protein